MTPETCDGLDLNKTIEAPFSRGELWREANRSVRAGADTLPLTEYWQPDMEADLLRQAVDSVLKGVSFRKAAHPDQERERVAAELLQGHPDSLSMLSFCNLFQQAAEQTARNYIQLAPNTNETWLSAYLHKAEADFAAEIAKTTRYLLRRQAVALREGREFDFAPNWQRIVGNKYKRAAKILKARSAFAQLFEEIENPGDFFQRLDNVLHPEEKQEPSVRTKSLAIGAAISETQKERELRKQENKRITDYAQKIEQRREELIKEQAAAAQKTKGLQKVQALRDRLFQQLGQRLAGSKAKVRSLLSLAGIALVVGASQDKVARVSPWQNPNTKESGAITAKLDAVPAADSLQLSKYVDGGEMVRHKSVKEVDRTEKRDKQVKVRGLAALGKAIDALRARITPTAEPQKSEVMTQPVVQKDQAWYVRGFDRSIQPSVENPMANKVTWQLTISSNGQSETYSQNVFIHLNSSQNKVNPDELGRDDVVYWTSRKEEPRGLNEQGESMYNDNVFEKIRFLVEGDRVWVPDIGTVNKTIEMINKGQIKITLREERKIGGSKVVVVRRLRQIARVDAGDSNKLDQREGNLKDLLPQDGLLPLGLRIDSRFCGSLVKGEEGFMDPLAPFRQAGIDLAEYIDREGSGWQEVLKNSPDERVREAFAEYEHRLYHNKSKKMIIAAWEIVEVKEAPSEDKQITAQSSGKGGENVLESSAYKLMQERRRRRAADQRYQDLHRRARF